MKVNWNQLNINKKWISIERKAKSIESKLKSIENQLKSIQSKLKPIEISWNSIDHKLNINWNQFKVILKPIETQLKVNWNELKSVEPQLKLNCFQLKPFLIKRFLWSLNWKSIERGCKWIESKWISIKNPFLSRDFFVVQN